jgi:hypothetical protein
MAAPATDNEVPLLFVSKYVRTVLINSGFDSRDLGVLFTPRFTSGMDITEACLPWACDNDAFSAWNEQRYLWLLDRITYRPGCRFVVAPDVPFDAATTLRRFYEWLPALQVVWRDVNETEHQPIALAAQNGIEDMEIPWEHLGALFIAGTTRFKFSSTAADLVSEAHVRGLWTHLGRVNSERRIEYAKALGVRSIDGSGWARFTNAMLPRGLAALRRPKQEMLPLERLTAEPGLGDPRLF